MGIVNYLLSKFLMKKYFFILFYLFQSIFFFFIHIKNGCNNINTLDQGRKH